MRKYKIWAVSAVIAMTVFVLAQTAGASPLLSMTLMIAGALGGSLLGSYLLMQRR